MGVYLLLLAQSFVFSYLYINKHVEDNETTVTEVDDLVKKIEILQDRVIELESETDVLLKKITGLHDHVDELEAENADLRVYHRLWQSMENEVSYR